MGERCVFPEILNRPACGVSPHSQLKRAATSGKDSGIVDFLPQRCSKSTHEMEVLCFGFGHNLYCARVQPILMMCG